MADPELPPMHLDTITPQTLSVFAAGKISPTDPRSEALIRGAVSGIRRHCRWHVSPSKEETLILDGTGTDKQRLPSLYVTDVSAVMDGGRTLVYRDDYRWSQIGLLERMHGCFSRHYRDVEVTLTHGHDDTPDLVALVHSVVARAMASPMGATREQAGAMSVSWATTSPGVSGGMNLLASEKETLDYFRLGSR